MQDFHSADHGNDFTGTPYVPVYVTLAVSVGYFYWFNKVVLVQEFNFFYSLSLSLSLLAD